ncbi:MAG: binding-protein-dependent transport system inner rane component [Bacteroidetes bacterium]|nr:binding-protein-dependent transport system inner rane component [Bacteroidota bacterium]
MRSKAFISLCIIFVLITWLQHEMIASAVVSFATWCALVLSHPGSLTTYWHPVLAEYWLAGVVWIATAMWMTKRILTILRNQGRHEGALATDPASGILLTQNRSVYMLAVIAYVAITAPFLTPINPNVQGNLITTRLLPPLSIGYVREYLDQGIKSSEASGVNGLFSTTRNYLLNRTVLVSGNLDELSHTDPGSIVIREFRTIFLFGTDDNARDVFSRVVVGTRVSLGIGLGAAFGALLIGAAIGFAAGMSRGFVDAILMRLTDLFLAIPSLFLVIAVLAFIGQSIAAVVLVLSFSGWMSIARIVRGEVVSLREREFILAAKLLQVPTRKIIVRHLIPNIKPVLITSAVLQFANAALAEAALGFLGLGIQPPTASWGNMMGEATGYLGSAWWVGVFPGVMLAAVIVSAQSVGETTNTTDDRLTSATLSTQE